MFDIRSVRHFAGAAAMASVLPSAVASQEVHQGSGEPLKFDLGYSTFANEGSTLSRSWVIVNDPQVPVSLRPDSFRGPVTGYGSQVGFIQQVKYNLEVAAPIAAVEIIMIPFDIWNRPLRPLALVEIGDFDAGAAEVEGRWERLREAEATQVLNVLAYVSRVRLESGQIIEADYDLVLAEALKISSGVTLDDVTPEERKDVD